ncbi:hypothetical protein [Rossellomorea marisflavi]|uniref:hypothetical protein n=1 Tax=Rossellomorea marisflavi TaxID=189381 RepID=UPI000B0CC857|nr:hypothetical protein [Rossellomorea marisflavi]MCM2607120.1 hypothetical protein [Rossellomorea marisflavi]USK92741.1 hypothetical protein LIT29_03075 [Rossellomorea marisflavi]
MSRGKAYESKKKGHPGNFPNGGEEKPHSEKPAGDEEYIVTQEAFKNRVDQDEHRL